MRKRIKEKTAIGGRVAKLREEFISITVNDNGEECSCFGMTQADLAKRLEEVENEPTHHISASLISQWETGNRKIPLKYNKFLCDIFNVTEEYLLGYTSDKQSCEPTVNSCKEDMFRIAEEDLIEHDKEPVWCVFTTYEYEDGWALYSAKRQVLIFEDGIRKIRRPGDIQYYTRVPDFESRSERAKRALDYAQVVNLKKKKVYVIMMSPDEAIRAKYNGWYLVDEEGGLLFNPWNSLSLRLDGINIAFRAYTSSLFTPVVQK